MSTQWHDLSGPARPIWSSGISISAFLLVKKKNMVIWKAAVSCWYLPRLFRPCFTQGARKLHAILKTIRSRTCGWLARQHVQVWTVLDWVTRCSAAYSVQHYFLQQQVLVLARKRFARDGGVPSASALFLHIRSTCQSCWRASALFM